MTPADTPAFAPPAAVAEALAPIRAEEGVAIPLAVESGSRAWMRGSCSSAPWLDDGASAQIAEQYRAGATAKTLSALWRVSPGSIHRHASEAGWTKAKRSLEVSQVMVARERERLAHAEQIAGEAEAARAPREAEPLEAAQTLLRRGAGSALKGRGEQGGANSPSPRTCSAAPASWPTRPSLTSRPSGG